MKNRYGVLAICSASWLSLLAGCGESFEETPEEELVLKSSESSLSCALYSENFDDGVANEITSGTYRVRWCNTYLPGAINTPPCLSGQTLRTNSSTINPTIWVNKGNPRSADASVRAGGVWPSRLVSDSGLLHTIDMVALFHSGYFCESSSP